ncbi:MAG: hypothetical protein HY594_03140 [Candidatus Omnitrophica bacterium]|nr:hypothetical protein [Candidatus Omnitrophota bacterium]
MLPAEQFIAKIDSSSTMLRAVAHYLRGKDLSGMGFVPSSELLAKAANFPPKRLRQYVYIFGGRREAVVPSKILELTSEGISRWVVGMYPRRKYPAVMVGSSNGALVHLCAAMKIPWLLQTVLVPVRRPRRLHPDELIQDMEAFRAPARRFLKLNPDLQINQMHDPIQDRLMVQQMGYFRVKRLRLGETYERFLKRRLEPGGTILVSECNYSWPMTQVGERHFFQVGGYGGLEPEEYLNGSRRIGEYLRRNKSDRTRWQAPKPDTVRPEAEWGLEPEFLKDLQRFAKENGYRIRRIAYDDPADPSPWVADLYRWWYAKRGMPSSRLFAESFLLLDPWWVLRTGSIPFWKVFNTGRSAQALKNYIRNRGPFDEIYITLFANSIRGIDQTSIEDWAAMLDCARKKKSFVGVDQGSYPFDLGVYFRFHADLKKSMTARLPMPHTPLTLQQVFRRIRGGAGPF